MSETDKKPEIRFKGFQEGWKLQKIEDIGEVVTGSTPSTLNSDYYSEDGLPWVTPTDILGNVTFNTAKRLSKKGEGVARIVDKDSILITSIASIGKNTMLGTKGSFNQQINALIPNKEKYYPYFLLIQSIQWSKKMKKIAAIGTIEIINKTEFSSIQTYLPGLIEQKQIGKFFEILDYLIISNQQKYEKLLNSQKTILEKMFPRIDQKIPEIRVEGFSDDWKHYKLGELYEFKYGQYNNNPSNGGQYPVFGANGIIGGYTQYNSENAVIIGHMGEYAGTVLWAEGKHFVTYNGTKAIPKYGKLDAKFGYYMLNHINIRKICGGSGLPFLSYEQLEKIDAVLPSSKEEQIKIRKYFDSLDNVINLFRDKLEKLKNIKEACLNKMFI